MEISVELHGQLSPGSPRRQVLEMPAGTSVRSTAAKLGIPPEEVGLVVINGVQGEMEEELTSGSRLALFPYITGG